MQIKRLRQKKNVKKIETENWIGLSLNSDRNQTTDLSVAKPTCILYTTYSYLRSGHFDGKHLSIVHPQWLQCPPLNYSLSLSEHRLKMIWCLGFKMMSHLIYMNNEWIIEAWSNLNLLWAYFHFIFTYFNMNSYIP